MQRTTKLSAKTHKLRERQLVTGNFLDVHNKIMLMFQLFVSLPAKSSPFVRSEFRHRPQCAVSVRQSLMVVCLFGRELRCPRNIIHTNLFVACLVTDALWLTVMTIEVNICKLF